MNETVIIKRRAFLGNISKVGMFGFLPIRWIDHLEKESVREVEDQFNSLTEPYLQNMKPDGIIIRWISSEKSLNWVEIAELEGESRKVFNSHHGLIDANNRIARLKIDNLKSDTTYQYRIFSKEIKLFEPYKVEYGDIIQKGPYSFTTPTEHDEQVSFVVFNDIHDNSNNIKELLNKFTTPDDYDFAIFNGDTFNWTDAEEPIINDFLTPIGEIFSSRKPFLMVQGNHETRGKYARQFFDYFDYPNNQCYYAFTRGPVRFIVLDSGEDKDDSNSEYSGLVSFDQYREEQAKWLAGEIKSKAFKQAAFRVVLIHIPMFHSGDWHGTLHCRKLFNPLLNKSNIDLSISGHTHRYGTFDADPLTHNYPIVIGGGSGNANRKGGQRTLIKVKATPKNLSLQMLVDDGTVVGSYNLQK